MNTTDRLSPSFGINSYFKERNLKPLQIWKVEHQNLHFFGSLGRKCNFLAPWDLKFEIRPMSKYILLCDIHHIKSVLTIYHLPEYNYFTRFGKQKQKLSDQFLGVHVLHLMIKLVIVIISLL